MLMIASNSSTNGISRMSLWTQFTCTPRVTASTRARFRKTSLRSWPVTRYPRPASGMACRPWPAGEVEDMAAWRQGQELHDALDLTRGAFLREHPVIHLDVLLTKEARLPRGC